MFKESRLIATIMPSELNENPPKAQKPGDIDLIDLGIPADKVAGSLMAARKALLECMPTRAAWALTQTELYEAAKIPIIYSRNAAPWWRRKWALMQKGLEALLSAGLIARNGTGMKKRPFRYFAKRP